MADEHKSDAKPKLEKQDSKKGVKYVLDSEQGSEEAFRYYALAADQGFTSGENNLGCCYKDGEGTEVDLGKARDWFERAAAKGDEEAMKSLADFDARV